jgi:signal peptidase I
MAAGTIFPLGLTVAPVRQHAPLPLRILSTLLILAAFAIVIGVPVLISGVTGYHLGVGAGRSMEPTLYAGDFVITRSVSAADLKTGDIILYNDGIKNIMHRIISIETNADGTRTFIAQGDNNRIADPPVAESEYTGKLVYQPAWLPRSPIDLGGTNLFIAVWLVSVSLATAGIILGRNPSRPSRATLRRSYSRYTAPR